MDKYKIYKIENDKKIEVCENTLGYVVWSEVEGYLGLDYYEGLRAKFLLDETGTFGLEINGDVYYRVVCIEKDNKINFADCVSIEVINDNGKLKANVDELIERGLIHPDKYKNKKDISIKLEKNDGKYITNFKLMESLKKGSKWNLYMKDPKVFCEDSRITIKGIFRAIEE